MTNSFSSSFEKEALRELLLEYNSVRELRKLPLKPAILEISDSETFWGQWVSDTRVLKISRKLLFEQPWHHVVGVLKHEMAHQVVDEILGADDSHGLAFRKACEIVGVPHFFCRSQVNFQSEVLDWRDEKRDEKSEARMEKVRRLLSLATSSNENEALAAMKKVRELYSQYNLEKFQIKNSDEYFHLVLRDRPQNISSIEKKIIGILVEHFFVQAIIGHSFLISSGKRGRTLEVYGFRENVLMAEYVFHFLSNHLIQATQGQKLSRVEKLSFKYGLLSGFEEKLNFCENDSVEKALVLHKADPQLQNYLDFLHPQLRVRKVRGPRLEFGQFSQGQEVGRKLHLHKPLSSHSKSEILLID